MIKGDKKIMDLCLFCAEEPTKECYEKHPSWIECVMDSNVLTPEEFDRSRKQRS